ncbi:MAG: pyruvate formate-lyase activating enzyme [Firmicutes bacterium]|nr:pyruvate formate-lyase activating enzyme [Bacillota bacterium]
MVGYYHSKETFGTVDGKGIRYVLFLAGCSLGCAFCHNPDSWARGDKAITVEEVMADVEQYRSFYEPSGGGITVSGGEPLLQPGFVAELFAACHKAKIHTTVDTAGFYRQDVLDAVLEHTDHVLFSLKAVDAKIHQYLTKADNTQILENLQYIAKRKPIALRYVVVPGINDTEEEISALAALLKNIGGEVKVELLGYHTMGVYKWKELGMEYKLADVKPASKEDVKKVQVALENAGIEMQY